eukprot:gene14204-19058_t
MGSGASLSKITDISFTDITDSRNSKKELNDLLTTITLQCVSTNDSSHSHYHSLIKILLLKELKAVAIINNGLNFYSQFPQLPKLVITEDNINNDKFNKYDHDMMIIEMDGLEIINPTEILQKCQFTNQIFLMLGIEAPSNNITDESIRNMFNDYTLSHLTSHIHSYNLSSNKISNVHDFLSYQHSLQSLLRLDLSFCEELKIEANCFAFSPFLQYLCLDGCNINSLTITTASHHHETESNNHDNHIDSIFYGLVDLKELSLKENNLQDLDSLDGLYYFSYNFIHNNNHIHNHSHNHNTHDTNKLVPTLTRLWLADNPVTEIQSSLTKFRHEIIAQIPSLVKIDEFQTNNNNNNNQQNNNDLKNILKRTNNNSCDNNDNILGIQSNGLDELEKEYLSALKGEKDVAIVS